jgi:hypothetical protein
MFANIVFKFTFQRAASFRDHECDLVFLTPTNYKTILLTHLNIIIDIATTVYANNTPILNIFTSAARSNNPAKQLVKTAALKVPITGVLNLFEMTPNSLNKSPSTDMAYKILGSGNIAPNKLAMRPTIPPIVTIHFGMMRPFSPNACGSGASASFNKYMNQLKFKKL